MSPSQWFLSRLSVRLHPKQHKYFPRFNSLDQKKYKYFPSVRRLDLKKSSQLKLIKTYFFFAFKNPPLNLWAKNHWLSECNPMINLNNTEADREAKVCSSYTHARCLLISFKQLDCSSWIYPLNVWAQELNAVNPARTTCMQVCALIKVSGALGKV